MARKPAPTKAHEPEVSPADQAFGAARAFVEHLAMVAQRAREYRPHPDKPDAWQDVAFNFAEAFIAWYDLTHLLTPAVCTEARRVYPPGAASIKLGAGSGAAPVVPAMPASVVNLLTAFRRVELDATPYPTVIEAVAGGLGVYFRNAVYTGRRHPLEPDTERVTIEAKARATARQVAQGKPAEPFGWGADYDELMKQETRAAVRARLGIKTYGDGQDLMMREWKAQDRARGESALYLLRCDPINFPDLRMQLIREAEAVIAAASKPNATPIDPDLLARLEAGIAAVHSIGSNFDAGMARVGRVIESLGARDDGPKPAKKPKPTRRERRVKWLAEAMLTVRDHPEWSDATIAERAGIDKSRLSRSPEYQAAAGMARTPKTPDGSVTIADGDRSVEAVDDSFDPNRPASRQWQDEEDTDDRIDREMKERNAKRNGRR